MGFSAKERWASMIEWFPGAMKGLPGEADTREVVKKFGDIKKLAAQMDKERNYWLDIKDRAKFSAARVRAVNADIANRCKALNGYCRTALATLNKANHNLAAEKVERLTKQLVEFVKDCQSETTTVMGAFELQVKLDATTYTGDWKDAKKRFEALTGRKKPTSTFMAAFRKSAGLEAACEKLDKAAKADDVKAFANALFVLEAKASEYVKALAHECQVAVSHDHIEENPQDMLDDKSYKQCVELLMNGLNKIRKDARENLKKVRH